LHFIVSASTGQMPEYPSRTQQEVTVFLIDLIFALVIGWVLVLTVSLVFDTKGPWGSFLWFFVVVSLFAWAGGIWIVPFGPKWGGIGWLPIIFMGIIASLILTAASPRKPRRKKAVTDETLAEEDTKVIVDSIFWVMIFCLLIFGFGRYAL
jgi:hypothetical protein